MLREELHHLQEPGSYVGEVIKQMGQKKVLVKINPEGKYVVDIDKDIDINELKMLSHNNAIVNSSINTLMGKWDKISTKLEEINKNKNNQNDEICKLEKQKLRSSSNTLSIISSVPSLIPRQLNCSFSVS